MVRSVAMIVFAWCAAAQAPGVEALGWMAGCWFLERNGVLIEEQWGKPGGGLMLGHSRTLRQGKLAGFEQLRIELREGVAHYVPAINGRAAAVAFRMVKASEAEVVFENASHDYPQRIGYELRGDVLEARTELLDEANPKRRVFAYRRVGCP